MELLIGANVAMADYCIMSQDNGPYTIKTMFGWTINGPIMKQETYATEEHHHMTVNRITVVKLDELWDKQFRVDLPESVQD